MEPEGGDGQVGSQVTTEGLWSTGEACGVGSVWLMEPGSVCTWLGARSLHPARGSSKPWANHGDSDNQASATSHQHQPLFPGERHSPSLANPPCPRLTRGAALGCGTFDSHKERAPSTRLKIKNHPLCTVLPSTQPHLCLCCTDCTPGLS